MKNKYYKLLLNESGFIWKNGSLVLTAAAAAIFGLILPLSGITFDVLLIFCLSLTAAIVLIAIAAKNTSETAGFPQLVVMTTAFQVCLSIAAVKLMMSDGEPGYIVNRLGGLVTSGGYIKIASISLSVAVPLMTFISMRKKEQTLKRTSIELIEYVSPMREIGIKGMEETAYISGDYARQLHDMVDKEKWFHFKTSRSAAFVLYCSEFELLVILIAVMMVLAGRIASPIAFTASGMLYLSALVTMLSCGKLAKKNVPMEIDADVCGGIRTPEPVEVVREEIIDEDHIEDNIIEHKHVIEEITSKDRVIESGFVSDHRIWTWKVNTPNKALESVIECVDNGDKFFLMASDSIKDMPVTAAVNTAMKIAKNVGKCLLVDFDFVHRSISKIFGASACPSGRISEQTGIGNLHVWSAADSSTNNVSEFKDAMAYISERYEAVLIYAPAIKGLATKQQIATCVDCAMLFADAENSNIDSMVKFEEILNANNTRVLDAGGNNIRQK